MTIRVTLEFIDDDVLRLGIWRILGEHHTNVRGSCRMPRLLPW